MFLTNQSSQLYKWQSTVTATGRLGLFTGPLAQSQCANSGWWAPSCCYWCHMPVHVQLSHDQDVSKFCFAGSKRMKPCDTNDWNEDGDHLEQLLREGEELRHLGGVQSGAAVPLHQELKRFRRLARPGRDPRAESGRAGWITSPICICKNLSMLPWELVVGCGERTVCNFTTETAALLTQTRFEHEILSDRKKKKCLRAI